MPETLTAPQLVAVLLTTTTILIFAVYTIVKNWVNSVNSVVDEVESFASRIQRLEGHDYHDLKGRVHVLMAENTLVKKDLADYKLMNDSRVSRAENTVAETNETLNNLRTTTASIETMVRDLWDRRQGERK